MKKALSISKPKDRKTPLQKAFDQVVKAHRIKLGLSQEELAEKNRLAFHLY